MAVMAKTIIYSHGFGVERDDRGLFVDIEAQISSDQSVMFDYNIIDRAKNTLTVQPIPAQVALLVQNLQKASRADDQIYLIAHSQGCLVASLLPDSLRRRIKKAVLITPAQTINVDAFLRKFADRPNTVIDRDGESRFHRRDGSTTIAPKAFLDSIEQIDLVKIYTDFCEQVSTLVISASADEVLGRTDFSFLDSMADVRHLRGDHNFSTPPERKAMIEAIKQFMS